MSVFRGIKEGNVQIVITEFQTNTRTVKVFPNWPFTTFEDKDRGWLTSLNLMEEKTVTTENDCYMMNTNPPKLLMTQKAYDAFVKHCKEMGNNL